MVEAVANSVEDVLIDGLSFRLAPGASYVQERKSSTFHPSGSNIYSTNGTKLIKLLVTGDAFLDPSTFRVMFDLVNMEGDNAKELRTVGGAHSFFRRMRVLCGGQVVEDIDNYNRVHEMFQTLTAKDSRTNLAAEAFGVDHYDWDWTLNADSVPGIPGGQSRTVLFKPLSGLLNQPKYLPIRYCPLTIELEIVNNASDPIVSYLGGSEFTNANTSLSWQIQNVQVKCDMCVLDNQLDNSYGEHLLSGKALPINYNTYVSQFQSLLSGANGQQKARLNVTRALSRLKSVFVTFDRAGYDNALVLKDWNSFYSPMADYVGLHGQYNSNGEIADFQLQLGSKLYPEYPIRSHAEAYYQLRKCLGVQSSSLHSFDITSKEYRQRKFILGMDFEKVLEAGFTGQNTRSGDILSVRFDHADNDATKYAHSMNVILHADCIMEVRDSGIVVFD